MNTIELTKGYVTIVDDADYEWLSGFNWWALDYNLNVYAACRIDGVYISMHRLIMSPEAGLDVDHIDRDSLNNQRYNLRCVHRSANLQNSPSRGGMSRHRGVAFDKRKNKWRAYINKDGVQYFLGYFTNQDDAALSYNQAARDLYGEHAYQNILVPGEVTGDE